MTKIVACYAICNEASTIAESIRSIKAYVDQIVVIDAAFVSNPLDFPPGAAHSTDGTRGIVEAIARMTPALPLTYLEASSKMTQLAARNAYLNLVEPPDWVFVIDGDEVLYGDHAQILATLNAIRAGQLLHSLAMPVYTVAVNVEKMAPDVTAREFARAPLISTMGLMPRLFAARATLRYTAPRPNPSSTPALTFLADRAAGRLEDTYLFPANNAPPDSMFLINHHTRQSLDGYLNDYHWATHRVEP